MKHARNNPEYNFRNDIRRIPAIFGATVLMCAMVLYNIAPAENDTEGDSELCGEDISPQTSYAHETPLDTPDPNTDLTRNEAIDYAAGFELAYDVPVVFLDEKEEKYQRTLHPFDPTSEEAGYSEVLNGLADGLSQLPADLIKTMELESITITGPMRGNGTASDAAGLYDHRDGALLVSQSDADTVASVTLHELAHALDEQYLCPGVNDRMISELTSVPYRSYDKGVLSEIYTGANSRREFAWDYGATSVAEDRATIMQFTFYERGLIQPGDLDYQSPFHAKQAEVVERLEKLTPGITKYLENRTIELRKKHAFGPYTDILHPFKKDTLSSPISVAAHAYIQGRPLTQMRDTVITVQPSENHEPVHILNPVIIQDEESNPLAILWTEKKGKETVIASLPYVAHGISTRSLSESAETIQGPLDTTSPDGDGFLDGGVSIGGVFAEQIDSPY